ncbi:hypothetical protein RFI_29445 [Reticulomyxa filosa]|uniref:Uncharacterized protein n=1 Tax=Reticulomyxa filosa TaxID=46433 RepID=X6M4I4_RETFI|nr:hypothetical protein RFI_29445 [Reticulomyxa filosa]|eukprot:ETO07945.1 hypothetical protein RFI_29445 [Reticulomyxa filosa]
MLPYEIIDFLHEKQIFNPTFLKISTNVVVFTFFFQWTYNFFFAEVKFVIFETAKHIDSFRKDVDVEILINGSSFRSADRKFGPSYNIKLLGGWYLACETAKEVKNILDEDDEIHDDQEEKTKLEERHIIERLNLQIDTNIGSWMIGKRLFFQMKQRLICLKVIILNMLGKGQACFGAKDVGQVCKTEGGVNSEIYKEILSDKMLNSIQLKDEKDCGYNSIMSPATKVKIYCNIKSLY